MLSISLSLPFLFFTNAWCFFFLWQSTPGFLSLFSPEPSAVLVYLSSPALRWLPARLLKRFLFQQLEWFSYCILQSPALPTGHRFLGCLSSIPCCLNITIHNSSHYYPLLSSFPSSLNSGFIFFLLLGRPEILPFNFGRSWVCSPSLFSLDLENFRLLIW